MSPSNVRVTRLAVVFAMLTVASVILLPGSAQATSIPITVQNASFEDNSWVGTSADQGGYTLDGCPKWTFTSLDSAGGAATTAALPAFYGIPDGNCAGWLGSAGTDGTGRLASMSQTLSGAHSTLEAGTYTLGMDMGFYDGLTASSVGDFQLWAGTTLLTPSSALTPSLPAKGHYDYYSKTYTVATADPSATLKIVLNNGTVGHAMCIFDAVGLTLTPAPEPGTLVLLGTALIGLLAYAWRKRK